MWSSVATQLPSYEKHHVYASQPIGLYILCRLYIYCCNIHHPLTNDSRRASIFLSVSFSVFLHAIAGADLV